MSGELLFFASLSNEQALRRNALGELERISTQDFAERLKVPLEALRLFLAGNPPDSQLLRGLSVYDFGAYPDLAQLMAAHFYESYDYDTGALENWEPAVDEFIEGESDGRVAGASLDIRRLLSTDSDDDTIRETLEQLGCRFSFNAITLTPRQWLEAVHDRLVSALGSRDS